jgi:hypothetical protein
MQQQNRKQTTLPATTEREHPIVLDHLERTKEPEIHLRSTAASARPYHRTSSTHGSYKGAPPLPASTAAHRRR